VATASAKQSDKKPKTTAQVAKAYFGAFVDRDFEAAAALWKPGCKDYLHGLAELTAPEGVKQYFGAMVAAIPDFEFEILELAASGKNAACRWRVSGTFTGPGRFRGLAPTGHRVVMEGCDMLTVEDGQIVANHAYTNAAELAQQLGLLPKEGTSADRAITGAFNAKTATVGALRKLRER
jgi:predicted ester cyclase